MDPEIPLFQLQFTEADRRAGDAVLAEGWVTSGPRVLAFEGAFAEALGAEHVIAVSSCTAALHLALTAFGVGQGHEVIVPAVTFVAASNVVRACGATPVFADVISLEEPTLCPESVARLITERTRAVILVHYAGYPAQVERLREAVGGDGIRLIEDSAHACITPTPRGSCGTLADAGAFSFFSNKNLAVGQGGALVVNDEETADLVRRLAAHGMTSRTLSRHRGHAHTYDVTHAGFNHQWDDLRAAILLERLTRLPDELEARRQLGARYRGALADRVSQVELLFSDAPEVPPHIFPVLLPAGTDRQQVMDRLRALGVQTSIHYPLLPAFSVFDGEARGEWAVAEEFSQRVLTLPFFPGLTPAELERVVAGLEECVPA